MATLTTFDARRTSDARAGLRAVAPAGRSAARLRRRALAAAGVVLVGIGAVGVFLPGLPTTIWLMGASYCFARSNPRLERRLIRNRFFGPYLRYLDRPASLSNRARLTATALMWCAVGTSLALTAAAGRLTPAWAAGIAIAAAIGTACLWMIGRTGRAVVRTTADLPTA